MKRFFPFFFPLIFLLASVSCGKKGSLQPPLARVPKKIEVFDLIQRGDRVIFDWENPTAYTDGSPLLEVAEVEIGTVRGDKRPMEEREFEQSAEWLTSLKNEEFSQQGRNEAANRLTYLYKLSAEDLKSEGLTFGLRVKDKKRRKSAFSNFLFIKPEILSIPPQNIKAAVFEDRIELSWSAPEKNFDESSPARVKGYNIYRLEKEGLLVRLNSGLVAEKKYDDRNFLFGNTYRYFVRASVTDTPPFLESEDSGVLEVLAKDTFSPAAPSGLVTIATENSISLSWDSNREQDLAGYRVWRRQEGEDEFILLTSKPIRENAFNDTAVEKDRRYYYAITAVDKSGNEGPKSVAVSDIVKDGV